MAKYIKTVGNYQEALKWYELPEGFADECPNQKEMIAKDLPRSPFVGFGDQTFEDFKRTWEGGDVSKSYTQGNMNASVFSELILQQSGFKLLPLEKMENKLRNHVCFAYFDDQGLPCGFSISYLKEDPTFWVASIINKTTADPEERLVTTFSREDMVLKDMVSNGSPQELRTDDLLEPLKSSSVAKLLASILLEDGSVNVAELESLGRRIIASRNVDNRDVRRVQFNDLKSMAPPTLVEQMIRMEQDQNLYEHSEFISAIEWVNDLFKRRVAADEAKDRLIYNMDLLITAIKLEVLASTKIDESETQLETILLDRAQSLRGATKDPNVIMEALVEALDFDTLVRDCEKECHEFFLDQFKTQLDNLKHPDLFSKGQTLCLAIQNVLDQDPNALPTMTKVLQSSIRALKSPGDFGQINILVALAKDFTQKESKLWQKLGAGLLMFIGVLMVVAGVVFAMPTWGVSLGMTVMGALPLGIGQAIWLGAKEAPSLPRSVGFFKEALAKTPSETGVHCRKNSEDDADSGLGEGSPSTTLPPGE